MRPRAGLKHRFGGWEPDQDAKSGSPTGANRCVPWAPPRLLLTTEGGLRSRSSRSHPSTGGSYYFLDLTALGRQEEWEEPKGRSDSARSATPDFAS